MSVDLKSWLVDIPGVVHRNQQVVLHAVSHEESQCMLSSTLPPVVIPGNWIKVHHGPSKGDIGMVSKLYPWGCKMLLSIPKLFDPTAVNAIEKGHLCYRSLGSTYKYDLLIRWFDFSLIQSALDILGCLTTVFAQSRHPQICQNISCLPRILEWCFQIGDKIMDMSRGRLGAIHGIHKQSLEDFHIGQYVEILEGTVGNIWLGWISAVENETLELIHPHGSTVETCSVHPNSIIVITEPNSMCTAPATTSPNLELTPNVPWKGMKVRVTKKNYCWGGKAGYLIDVSMIVDSNTGHQVSQLLVQLTHYDTNAPFVCVWLLYDEVVEEESWLPLNEAQLLEYKHEFFYNLVPESNVLRMRGRHISSPGLFPEQTKVPGNATPLPDPSEHCLSPVWNPSSLDPPSHWSLDPRLLGNKFHVSYNSHKIVALVKCDWQRNIVCVRDELYGETLDPVRVLAI
ncbi:hypothetical protein F5146DRAFT_1145616 [Armillaria mellea]|nr:hypothetical protein F5146DRAFT_1145616 [Armillaria mellea]